MISLLTFQTRRQAMMFATEFLASHSGYNHRTTRLHDGRFRLDLYDSPPPGLHYAHSDPRRTATNFR
jgi:hypothetical protein